MTSFRILLTAALVLLAFGGAGPLHACAIADDALAVLQLHDWPGNIRELENLIERIVITAGPEPIGIEHLPELKERAGARGGFDFELPPDRIALRPISPRDAARLLAGSSLPWVSARDGGEHR